MSNDHSREKETELSVFPSASCPSLILPDRQTRLLSIGISLVGLIAAFLPSIVESIPEQFKAVGLLIFLIPLLIWLWSAIWGLSLCLPARIRFYQPLLEKAAQAESRLNELGQELNRQRIQVDHLADNLISLAVNRKVADIVIGKLGDPFLTDNDEVLIVVEVEGTIEPGTAMVVVDPTDNACLGVVITSAQRRNIDGAPIASIAALDNLFMTTLKESAKYRKSLSRTFLVLFVRSGGSE